jgi:RNA polymerase sigma-70 factor, ECF subfamily
MDSHRQDAQDLAQFLADSQSERGRQAAGRLLQRHRQRVYLWCFRYMRDHDRALDLAQDVLLLAYKKLPDYSHDARFTSWLFIIARNRCLSEARKSAPDIITEFELDTLRSDNPGPDRELDKQDLWKSLARHLDREEMDVLYLKYVEGFPVDSITDILKITPASGARGVLQRARRKLRSAFGSQGASLEGSDHD